MNIKKLFHESKLYSEKINIKSISHKVQLVGKSPDKLTIDPARLCLKSVRLEPVERRGVFDKLSPNGVNTSPCRINSSSFH
jgi:hypothetical protein